MAMGCYSAAWLVRGGWFLGAVLQDAHMQTPRVAPIRTLIRSKLSFNTWLILCLTFCLFLIRSLLLCCLDATSMCISHFWGPLSLALVLELVKHLIIGSIGTNLLIFLGVSPHDLLCI